MKKIKIVLRLDVTLVQRIECRPESWKPERPDGGKTTSATLIDAIARSLLIKAVRPCDEFQREGQGSY